MIPTQAENREVLACLREAYLNDILQPPETFDPVVDLDFPCIDSEDMQRLATCEDVPIRVDRPFDQIGEPARDTRRLQYQDSTNFFERGNFPNRKAWECARFVVMPDETGFVKKCETALDIQTGAPPEHVFLDPTDPRAADRLGVSVQWFLRLYQGTFQPLPDFEDNIPIDEVMGYPFPELPYWSDNRFQWGKGTKENVFWLIPSNHVLRLFFVAGPIAGNILKGVQGRLMGYTQPVRIEAGYRNVVYDW